MKTSILISSYNYGSYISNAIESALKQSVPVHEIIIVDDGSTDNSREIIESFGESVIPVFQDNRGQAAAISNGFAHATGDIVMLLDADDIFHPHKVEIIQQIYIENPAINWVFHDLKEVHVDRMSAEDVQISKDITPKRINQTQIISTGTLNYDSPATSGLTFRKKSMADFFPMPRADGINLSDHYIKFYCLATSEGLHVSEPLAIQVIHDKNLYTGKQSHKALATRARIFANTAIYLEKIAPHTEKFCQNLMSEALSCAHRAGIYKEVKQLSTQYLKDMSWTQSTCIQSKAFLKSVLQNKA